MMIFHLIKGYLITTYDAYSSNVVISVSIHFLHSRAARTLTLAFVFRMTETQAEKMFRKIRWSETMALRCARIVVVWSIFRPSPVGLLRFRCKAVLARTLASLAVRCSRPQSPVALYLAAIAVFMNEVKGKNALALSRDLGMSHKACWVLLHKVREAMAEEFKGRKLGGDGKVCEVDGMYAGGYQNPQTSR